MTIKQSGIFHHSHDDCILDLQLVLKIKTNFLKNHLCYFPFNASYYLFNFEKTQPAISRYPYS